MPLLQKSLTSLLNLKEVLCYSLALHLVLFLQGIYLSVKYVFICVVMHMVPAF